MANPLLKILLGSLFAGAMRGRARSGPFGTRAPSSGGLGDVLGGMVGRGGLAGGRMGGNRGMLLAMLLPFAMQWVQRNGGVGAVLERFRQKGYSTQAKSWMSTGDNETLDADAVDNVIGREELSRLARQLGVPEAEVADGFAEILPEVVDQLSPEGSLPPEADDALDGGLAELEKELSRMTTDAPA